MSGWAGEAGASRCMAVSEGSAKRSSQTWCDEEVELFGERGEVRRGSAEDWLSGRPANQSRIWVKAPV
jgi:hypothetical protein